MHLPQAIVLLLLHAADPVSATDTVVGKSCDLSVLGAGDTGKRDFLAFDLELRKEASTERWWCF